MSNKLKKIPKFKLPEQEAEFWESHSVADYQLFPSDVEEILKELKSRAKPKRNVTLRLELELMNRLKKKAKSVGVKYQTFVREWLWRAVM